MEDNLVFPSKGLQKMRDYLTLGTTPADEECAQVGTADYWEKTKAEARRYKAGLERYFKQQLDDPDTLVYLTLKSFPHDFGTYHELCVIYNDADEKEIEAAFEIENNLPSTWEELENGPPFQRGEKKSILTAYV